MRSRNRYARRLRRLLLITAAVCTLHTIFFGAVFPRAHLEVERKFSTPPDLRDRVNKTGGQFIEREQFKDTYLDTPDALLGRNDVWLRRRNDTLQLKIPFNSGGQDKTSFFREEDDPKVITKELQKYIPSFSPSKRYTKAGKAAALYAALLQELVVVAEFSTVRTTYKLQGLNIVSDEADFGYTVTEIEHVDDNEAHDEKVGSAVDLINNVGVKVLRLKPLGKQDAGKLDVYLRTQNPQYRRHLVEAEVVDP